MLIYVNFFVIIDFVFLFMEGEVILINQRTKTVVTAAFFVALDIIVLRFLSFEIPTVGGPIRFDFQIVVAALCGYALGPTWGGLSLLGSDLLSASLSRSSIPLFPGFTLSAFLKGFLFGLLLHKRDVKTSRLILSVVIVFILVDFLLSTYWISILSGTPYMVLFVSRILPKSILLTAEIIASVGAIKIFEIIRKRKVTI